MRKKLKAETECKENEDLADAIIQAFDNEKKVETFRNLKEKQQELDKLYEHFTEFEQNLKEASERLSDSELEYEVASKNCSKSEKERAELRVQKNTLENEIAELQKARDRLGIFAGKKKKETDDKIVECKEHLSVISESLKNIENEVAGYKDKCEYWRRLVISHRETVENCKSILKGYSSKEEVERSLNEISENIAKKEMSMVAGMSIDEAKKQYRTSEKIREIVRKKKPILGVIFAAKGDIVEFGSYPQQQEKKKEPIKWIVLEKRADKVLLISRYALDYKKYNKKDKDITWKDCTLRKWLNDEFIETAFDKNEQKHVAETILKNKGNRKIYGGGDTLDKIFLLSIDEAEKYFSSDDARKCEPTKYAKAQYVHLGDNGCCWWLRSPGDYRNGAGAARVFSDGSVGTGGYSVDSVINTIRPALWINLES